MNNNLLFVSTINWKEYNKKIQSITSETNENCSSLAEWIILYLKAGRDIHCMRSDLMNRFHITFSEEQLEAFVEGPLGIKLNSEGKKA